MNYLMRKLMARGGYMAEADDGGKGDAGGNTDDNKGGQGDDKGDQGNKQGGNDGNDGKGGTSDAEAKLLKEVMDKKTANKKLADELVRVNEQLKKYEGVDVEQVKALLKDREDAETKSLEAKGEWDRLKQRMADEHSKEKAELQTQVDALKGEVGVGKGTINDLTIGSSFGTSKFISEELTLTPTKARMIYSDHFDFVDGSVVGFDKPRGAANRTQFVDSRGDPVSFDEAMKKIVEADPDRDELTKSRMKKGADSSSQKGAPPEKSKDGIKGMSRIAAGLKKGIAK